MDSCLLWPAVVNFGVFLCFCEVSVVLLFIVVAE
jgi:hypothetical protein